MDIDKQYILGFSINDNGKLQTLSNLQNERGVTIDQVNKLPKPNGIKYTENSDSSNIISLDELQAVTRMLKLPNVAKATSISLDPFVKILNSNVATVAFSYDPSLYTDVELMNIERAKKKFIRMLNKHSLTKLNNFATEQALKNQVVQRALDITLDPRNQVNLQIPVVMKQVQNAASKSTMGKDERYISSFNPYSKYLMQYQNMVGKQVIGIGAVSMKVYFAIQTYIDAIFDQIPSLLETQQYTEVLDLIDRFTIEHPITGKLAVLANINVDDVIEYIKEHNLTTVPATLIQVPAQLSGYISNGQFDLKQCLIDIQTIARTTDGAETLSEIVSSATDNAKELTLAKINCTSKFADIYTYLVSIGTPFNEITNIMMSPIFNEVAKLAETDIFDANTYKFNLKSALEFYTNTKQLPFVDSQVFVYVLSDAFLKQLGVKDSVIQNITNLIVNSKGTTQVAKAMDATENNEDLDEVITGLRSLYNKIKNQYYASEEDESGEYGYFDEDMDAYYATEEISEEDDLYDGERRDWKTNPLKPQEIRSLITLFEYCKLKNEQRKKQGDSFKEQIQNLDLLVKKIIPATEEQNVMGRILSINQGMKTNAYDKYNFIRGIENFVNKRITKYNKDGNNSLEKFDLMRFLSDEMYKTAQIRNYDLLKTTYNILEAINEVPHFKSMFDILYVDNYLIHEYSVHNTLVNELSKKVLLNKDFKLNQDEFGIVQKYANDVLILNALLGSNLTLKLPKDVGRYTGYGDEYFKSTNENMTVPLNSMESLATFKRYMDVYLIPMLKNPLLFDNVVGENLERYSENAFIKSLSRAVIGDRKSGRIKSYWRIGHLNMMQIDASQKSQIEYEKVLAGFNEIKDVKVNGWRIADLFYLYNLITNKDSFGKSSMTRLFEDLVSAGDKSLLINQFYDFMAKLDLNPNKDQLVYDIKDLQFRLANSTTSKQKFGSYKIENNVYVPEIADPISLSLIDPSYFTFDMPYLRGNNIRNLRSGIINPIVKDNSYYEIKLDSKEALNAIVERFNQHTNLKIKLLTKSEIEQEFPNDLRAQNANAFIHNGQIFINSDNAKIDAPLHEFAHLYLAQLRINDPTTYYDWLSKTANHPNAELIAKTYPNLTGNDLQEEIFVKVLSDLFNNIVSAKYDPSYVFQDKEVLINAINSLFASEIPTDSDLLELMATPTDEVLYGFLSKMFTLGNTKINESKVMMSQKLSTAKYKWIKNGYIKENCI